MKFLDARSSVRRGILHGGYRALATQNFTGNHFYALRGGLFQHLIVIMSAWMKRDLQGAYPWICQCGYCGADIINGYSNDLNLAGSLSALERMDGVSIAQYAFLWAVQ